MSSDQQLLQALLAAAATGSGGMMQPPPQQQPVSMAPHLTGFQQFQQAQAAPQTYNLLAQLLATSAVPNSNPYNMASMQAEHVVQPEPARQTTSRGRPTKSNDTRNTNNYASRHQQAEARRRQRINDRLDALRRIVPHTERANTAAFLEDVVKHVQLLQRRCFELETKLGVPVTVRPLDTLITFGETGGTGTTPDGTFVTGATDATGTLNAGDVLYRGSGFEQLATNLASLNRVLGGGNANGQPAVFANGSAQQPEIKEEEQPQQQQQQQQQQKPVALPTASEELAMAAELAPQAPANGGMMAENQPAAKNDAANNVQSNTDCNADVNTSEKRAAHGKTDNSDDVAKRQKKD